MAYLNANRYAIAKNRCPDSKKHVGAMAYLIPLSGIVRNRFRNNAGQRTTDGQRPSKLSTFFQKSIVMSNYLVF